MKINLGKRGNKFMYDTFEMLEELLEQQQFELLIEENKIRLVYLMNDAVESFLIFDKVRLTGNYLEGYEGPLKSSLSEEDDQYVLSVWQGENVVTLFFENLDLEVHLYNYGEIGHFWVPSEAAFETMEELAEEVKDRSLLRLLAFYKRFPKPVIARLVAGALHQNRHTAVIDLLTEKLKKEAAVYPNRSFGEKADQQLNSLLEKARMLQQNLAEQGVKAEVLREEPFTTARDSLDFQVFLMIWKKGWRNRKVEIKKLTEKM